MSPGMALSLTTTSRSALQSLMTQSASSPLWKAVTRIPRVDQGLHRRAWIASGMVWRAWQTAANDS